MLKKRDEGGKGLHCLNEVNDANKIQNSFPDVLKKGMNNVNNVNNALKSKTYDVNAVKTKSEHHEHV